MGLRFPEGRNNVFSSLSRPYRLWGFHSILPNGNKRTLFPQGKNSTIVNLTPFCPSTAEAKNVYTFPSTTIYSYNVVVVEVVVLVVVVVAAAAVAVVVAVAAVVALDLQTHQLQRMLNAFLPVRPYLLLL